MDFFLFIATYWYTSIKPFAQPPYPAGKPATAVSGDIEAGHPPAQAPWEGRAIATHKFRLLEFSGYMEIQRDEIVRAISLLFFFCFIFRISF